MDVWNILLSLLPQISGWNWMDGYCRWMTKTKNKRGYSPEAFTGRLGSEQQKAVFGFVKICLLSGVIPSTLHTYTANQCLTCCWHMFVRAAFALVFSLLCVLLLFAAPIDPISTWGSLKFHLILNLKAKKERKRKQDNRAENWRWISKVLITTYISSCCPCVHYLTQRLKPLSISIETWASGKWGRHDRYTDLSIAVLTPACWQGISLCMCLSSRKHHPHIFIFHSLASVLQINGSLLLPNTETVLFALGYFIPSVQNAYFQHKMYATRGNYWCLYNIMSCQVFWHLLEQLC